MSDTVRHLHAVPDNPSGLVTGAFWNVQQTESPDPPLEAHVSASVHDLRYAGASIVALAGVHHWERYDGEDNRLTLAEQTGFSYTYHQPFNDPPQVHNDNAGSGLVIATDHKAKFSPVELGKQFGLRAVLEEVGSDGLQVVVADFDPDDEDVRLKQIFDLLKNIEHGVPTILHTSLHELSRDMHEAGRRDRTADFAIRSIAKIVPARIHIGQRMKAATARRASGTLKAAGFKNVNKAHLPNAPAALPLVATDHVLYKRVEPKDFRVGENNGASNHRPLFYTVQTLKAAA